MALEYYGYKPSAVDALQFAIQECLEDWNQDPTYNKAAQKLREVQRELDVLTASPGSRAAARAAGTNQSGQEPSGDAESA